MIIYVETGQTREVPKFKLDMDTTIKQALRALIDNRQYRAAVMDEGEVLAVVSVRDLHNAMDMGHKSSLTLFGLIYSNALGRLCEG